MRLDTALITYQRPSLVADRGSFPCTPPVLSPHPPAPPAAQPHTYAATKRLFRYACAPRAFLSLAYLASVLVWHHQLVEDAAPYGPHLETHAPDLVHAVVQSHAASDTHLHPHKGRHAEASVSHKNNESTGAVRKQIVPGLTRGISLQPVMYCKIPSKKAAPTELPVSLSRKKGKMRCMSMSGR